MADAIMRYAGSRLGAPELRRHLQGSDEALDDRLDELLDPVLCRGEMSGAQWDELSYQLITRPTTFLPSRMWASLAERLLSEVIIAEGIAWFQRFEALSRILGHPRGQHAVISACGELVNDPTNQVFMEPLSIMDGSRHRAANLHVTRQLASPTNDQALRGALLASVRKVRDNHFDGAELIALHDLLVQHISDQDTHLNARPLASEVLRLIPLASLPKRGKALDRALREDEVLDQVVRTGRIARAQVTAATVSRICALTLGSLGEDPHPELERGLRVVTEEMLYSPVSDVRLLAAQMVAVTPLRGPMADVLTQELTTRSTTAAPVYSTAVLGVLPFLAFSKHRAPVERLALRGPLPSAVADGAVWALAHLPAGHRSPFWNAALRSHLSAWERTSSSQAERTIRGLVYGLGVHQHDAALRLVQNDTRFPATARTAARWWLGIARDIRTSARL
ncbi:hypothetical protein [Amycolatopsis sp. 195334CR]|uniref:hypothetical protein n=1 Tax=Amycolatopsis sp. 195334CR TaxID=2814588 RepID=UPI001A8C094C|nr:hypothetical protein [Amycolatopsis sp. 195334CR]MBN6034192.1 hypothetical protein [Amycolatopsis sp. 195334CR]